MVAVVFGQVVSNLLDLVGIGIIPPYLYMVMDRDITQKNLLFRAANEFLNTRSHEHFVLVIGFFLVFTILASAVFKVLSAQAVMRFVKSVYLDLSVRQLRMVTELKYGYVQKEGLAKIKFAVMSDLTLSVSGVLSPTLELASKGIVSVVTIASLLAINPLVMLGIGAVVGISYATIFRLQKKAMQEISVENRQANRNIMRTISEIVSGSKEIKFYNAQGAYGHEVLAMQRSLAQNEYRLSFNTTFPRILFETVAILLVLSFILANVGNPGLIDIVPVLGVVVVVFFRLNGIFQGIFVSYSKIKVNLHAYKSFKEKFVDFARPENHDKAPPEDRIIKSFSSIELKDVSFEYLDGEEVLKGASVRVNAGETIGLIGPSGSGKTTLVDLMGGLYRPKAGALLVDGRPIDGPECVLFGNFIGYVSQASILMDRSIRENIAFGVAPAEIDNEKVVASARMAQIHDFVSEKVDGGYEARLGEDGVKMSGGQKQRIAIARALYRDAKLLIFDEATSALDGITESMVMESIAAMKGKITMIIIAHRLKTVMNCDRIYVLKEGKIVDQGAWKDLIANNELVQMMAGERKVNGEERYQEEAGRGKA